MFSGIATGGGQGGQSATPDSKKLAKKREKVPPLTAKNWPKRGRKSHQKTGKRGKKSRKKEKNRKDSFTLLLLTDRAGYTTADIVIIFYCKNVDSPQ